MDKYKNEYKFFDDNILFDFEFTKYAYKLNYNSEIIMENKIKILELINKNKCILCTHHTYFLSHCIQHIKEINVNNLYEELLNIFSNENIIEKRRIKLYLLDKLIQLQSNIDNYNINKINNNMQINLYINKIDILYDYYWSKNEFNILIHLFQNNKDINNIINENNNNFKIICELVNNKIITKHLQDIEMNKYFIEDNKIHKSDVIIDIKTFNNIYHKIAIDLNDININNNIYLHQNVNKDNYYRKNNYSIIKIDLLNKILTKSNIYKIINKIVKLIICEHPIYYFSNNYIETHTNMQELTPLENKNYMNNINLDIIEKVSLYDNNKNYIYVLKLINDKYYIGRTSNIQKRILQHTTKSGSSYTKKFKPIDIIEITNEISIDDENNKTIEMMKLYNWQNVRGGTWCYINLNNPPLQVSIFEAINNNIIQET
jgi:hypothetical protein